MPMRTPGKKMKPTAGRPKNPRRAVTRTIYLKAEEDAELIRAAKTVALPVSAYIRSRVLLAARGEA